MSVTILYTVCQWEKKNLIYRQRDILLLNHQQKFQLKFPFAGLRRSGCASQFLPTSTGWMVDAAATLGIFSPVRRWSDNVSWLWWVGLISILSFFSLKVWCPELSFTILLLDFFTDPPVLQGQPPFGRSYRTSPGLDVFSNQRKNCSYPQHHRDNWNPWVVRYL